jgi:hypothetical protein
MIMRQYELLRERQKDAFTYRSMKPVQIIILMENSGAEFHKAAPYYMHHRQVTYDSGITVPELTEVLYVALDTFQEVVQNEIKTDLHGWLTLLSARNVETITKLIEKFPEFLEIYQEMAAFRKSPEEVVNMFSDALAIMDRNTEAYMVEEARQKLIQKSQELEQEHQEKILAFRRADQAESRADQAEADQRIAESRADQAEAGQRIAESRADQAEAELQLLKARLAKYESQGDGSLDE